MPKKVGPAASAPEAVLKNLGARRRPRAARRKKYRIPAHLMQFERGFLLLEATRTEHAYRA